MLHYLSSPPATHKTIQLFNAKLLILRSATQIRDVCAERNEYLSRHCARACREYLGVKGHKPHNRPLSTSAPGTPLVSTTASSVRARPSKLLGSLRSSSYSRSCGAAKTTIAYSGAPERSLVLDVKTSGSKTHDLRTAQILTFDDVKTRPKPTMRF